MAEDYIVVNDEKVGLSGVIVFKYHPTIISKVLNEDVDFSKFDDVMIAFGKNSITIKASNKIKTLKVEASNDYVYKFMKTKVKAMNGIYGLRKTIEEANEVDALFNGRIYKTLVNATI